MEDMKRFDENIDRLMETLLNLDVDSDEWTRVAEERRKLLIQRIRLKPELKILLSEELHHLLEEKD